MSTRAEYRKQWEERVADYHSSGQSVTEWCKDRGVKPEQLWAWLRRVKPADKPAGLVPSKWVTVEIGSPATFATNNGLLVKVGKAIVEVKPGFNPALLTDVVRSLSTLC